MEPVVDEEGRLLRTPEALAVARRHGEAALGPLVAEVAVDEQEWGAGGGLHLSGTWRPTATPMLIKLGVDANQLYWARGIVAVAPTLMPTLFAAGERLGELSVGWTVMERVPYGPLGPDWRGGEFAMRLDAAVRFQRAARLIQPRYLAALDVAGLGHWLEAGLALDPPGPAGDVVRRLEADYAWVTSVCGAEVCHGDVHLGNALSRRPPPLPSAAVLIDCQPRAQPWACDAACAQVLNSIDESRVGYRDLVPRMAGIRSAHGLPSLEGRDLQALSAICLGWFAIRLWGLCPDRHQLADYRAETRRYIMECAALLRR